MTAKEYVEQIKKIDTKIKNKHIEKLMKKQQYFEIATSVCPSTEMERVQSSSNGQKMADAVINGVEIERKIDQEIIALEDKRQSIIANIERLSEPEYDVLHLIYVQYLTFDEAADKRKKSKRWVVSTHGTALQNLEKISNCRELREFA